MIEGLWQDVRYALRLLRRNPGYTAVAAMTLALGIGANTAIFSIVNTVLLRDLPYAAPDQLVMVWLDNRIQGFQEDLTSYPYFQHLRQENSTLADLAAYRRAQMGLTGVGDPERLGGAAVTPSFFDLLGVPPLRGRTFLPEEGQPGAERVVVLSHGLWNRRFAADEDVVGRTVTLDGTVHTVVGVMPAGFGFPESTDIWTALIPTEQARDAYGSLWLYTVGRLQPGTTALQARTDLDGIISRATQERGQVDPTSFGATVNPLHAQLVGDVRSALWILFGAVGMVLLVACANVANLSLARAAAREGEMALRIALGAGGSQLIRLLLTESIILAAFGGAVGLFVAHFSLQAVAALAPAELPRLEGIGLDTTVLSFTVAASVLAALLFGLVPAWQASHPDLQGQLREGAASQLGGRRRGLRRMLVIAEVAAAVVLLIGAGLLIKSFVRLHAVDVGFETEGLIAMQLTLPSSQYPEVSDVRAFHTTLMERLRAVPGVQDVGLGTSLLVGEFPQSGTFAIEGRTFEPEDAVEVLIDSADPQLFQLLGVPILQGRLFDHADADDQSPVILINQTMAEMFWRDQDPVGHRITFGDPGPDAFWFTIVGVVGDRRRAGLQNEPRPATFYSYVQYPARAVDIVVASDLDPTQVIPSVRRAVWDLDAGLPISQLETVETLYEVRAAGPRFNMMVLGLLAAVALAMAAAGVYGVTTHSVAQRTRELGLRMALGAQSQDVVRLVIRQSLGMIAVGLGIGVVIALIVTRFMASLIYNVSETDVLTFASVVAVLGVVGLIASLIPAVRAGQVDAMQSLRE